VSIVFIFVHEKLVRINLTSYWVHAILRDYAVPGKILTRFIPFQKSHKLKFIKSTC
jgi:hypothetical protein